MKKFASLIMAAVLLATMLTVFAVPVSAVFITDNEISGTHIYNEKTTFMENVTIKSGASVTINADAFLNDGITMKIESGATVTFNGTLRLCRMGTMLIIESGASVTINENLELKNASTLEIGGVLTGKFAFNNDGGSITLLPGGIVDVETKYDHYANSFIGSFQNSDAGAKVEQTANGTYRVTAHRHVYAGTCCLAEHMANTAPAPTGSTLSEGNLTIIVGIAAAVVFGLGGFILGTKKKKKTAVAGGENTDEE